MSGSTKFFNMSSTFSVHSDLAQGLWEALPIFKDLSSLVIPPFFLPGRSGQNSVPIAHLDVSSGQVLAIVYFVHYSYLTASSRQISDPASPSSCAALASPVWHFFLCRGVLCPPGSRDIFQFPLDHLWNWLASLSPGQDISDFLLLLLSPSVCSVTVVSPVRLIVSCRGVQSPSGPPVLRAWPPVRLQFPFFRSWCWQLLSSSGQVFFSSLFSPRTLSAGTIAIHASRRPPVTCASWNGLGSSFWHCVFSGLWSRFLFSCHSHEDLSFGRRSEPTCDVLLRWFRGQDRCFLRGYRSVVLPSVQLCLEDLPRSQVTSWQCGFWGTRVGEASHPGPSDIFGAALLEANPLPHQDFPDATHYSPDVPHDSGLVPSVAVAPPGSCPPPPGPSSATLGRPVLQDSAQPPLSKFRAPSSGIAQFSRARITALLPAVDGVRSSRVTATATCEASWMVTFLSSGFRVLVMGSARSATGFSPPEIVVDARRAGPRTLPLCLVRSLVGRFPMTCPLLTRFSRLASVFVPRSSAELVTFGVLA